MKNQALKKLLPHVIAVAVFLIVSLIFCKPVLDGNVLNQHDTIGWKGMAQNSFEYKERTGHFPLWNPNLFSGMPNYQVAMEGKSVLPDFIKIFTLGLPKPINFFFLACVCFYILCIVLRTRPVIAILAAIAFAFSTYNPVVINAGHDTQILATGIMPLLLAGLLLIYEKKYWLGLALTTLGATLEIGMSHLQITYYFFLIALIVTIAYLVVWIRNKEWKHIVIAGGLTIISAVIAIAASALLLMTTSEYVKYTMRGGKSISIEGDSVTVAKTTGLDTSYAFEYSLRKTETSTLLMPNAFGGASDKTLGEGSKVIEKLTSKGVPEGSAMQVADSLPKYWGDLPYTAGPAYLGIIIFILGLIGFVIVKHPLRWALLAATLLGILLSWGKNLAGFNTFLFEHLPMYNKFRAPSMAQVIPQFTMCIMAALTLQRLLFVDKSRELLKADFKKVLYSVGGLFALLGLFYMGMEYSSPIDGQIMSGYSQQAKSEEIGRAIIDGMKADRKAMFGGQLLRAFGFGIILVGLLYLYIRNTLKPMAVAIILLVVSSFELLLISRDYLSEEHYVSPEELAGTNFTASPIDQQILQDKDPNFRVYNMGNPFNESKTSYFHKSIGGYHPAKLRIYQDVIEKYLYAGPGPVMNMLNTKYFIIQDQQTGQPMLIPNPNAYGNCWLVKTVKIVDGPVEAIKAIGTTSLRDTAIVEKTFSDKIIQPQWDSASTIKMTKFDNDAIEYEANCNGPQFAVFSEVYYPAGWNVYLDGKKAEYVNTNYILRGMSLPAGKHSIKFVFEPATYKKAVSIGYIASFAVLLLVLGGFFMAWWQRRKTVNS